VLNLDALTIAQSAVARLSWSPSGSLNLLQGQSQALLGEIHLRNISGSPLAVSALQLQVLDGPGLVRNPGEDFTQLNLVCPGAAASLRGAPFAGDQWLFPSPLVIPAQGEIALQVVGDLAAKPAWQTFQLSLPGNTCLNQGALLAESDGGQAFPLLSAPLHVRSLDLGSSFSTYPNPFKAGQESAKIVYGLARPGSVSVQVFTLAQELVKTVAEGDQGAGLQTAVWDGRNQEGRQVLSGVYWVRLKIRYTGGGADSAQRKIAVVR
jgi:hypothetical protein